MSSAIIQRILGLFSSPAESAADKGTHKRVRPNAPVLINFCRYMSLVNASLSLLDLPRRNLRLGLIPLRGEGPDVVPTIRFYVRDVVILLVIQGNIGNSAVHVDTVAGAGATEAAGDIDRTTDV